MIWMKFSCAVIASLLFVFCANQVFANGINPPRPHEAVIVKAICTTRESPGENTIFRARIDDGALSELLSIQVADVSETVSIADIRSIKFEPSPVSESGYLDAKLVRQGAENDESVSVKVQAANDNPIALTGFSATGSRVRVALSDCAVIHFSTSATSEMPAAATPMH